MMNYHNLTIPIATASMMLKIEHNFCSFFANEYQYSKGNGFKKNMHELCIIDSM